MPLIIKIILIASYALTGFYILYILYSYIGIKRLKAHKLKKDEDLPNLTVIVCAKDEENCIEDCIRSIYAQDYPKEKYSLIVVNDRSEDRTSEILKTLQEELSFMTLLEINECPAGISPKKNAISIAMEICKTEFIVATDADATHHSKWLRSYGSLCDNELGASTGLSIFSKKEFRSKWEEIWQKMQTLESLSHNVIIAGAMMNGFVITANGNNMLYRKDLFKNKNTLRTDIVSGDDMDIILEAQKQNYKIVFNSHPASVVTLIPENSISDVINQRVRWASKTLKATSSVIIFGLSVFIFYLLTILLPFLAIIDTAVLPYWCGILIIKAICDFFYMIVSMKKFGISFKFKHLFMMEVFHSLFVVWIGLYGTFGTFTWKGASYKKTLKDNK